MEQAAKLALVIGAAGGCLYNYGVRLIWRAPCSSCKMHIAFSYKYRLRHIITQFIVFSCGVKKFFISLK
jgi:hypothetical protein